MFRNTPNLYATWFLHSYNIFLHIVQKLEEYIFSGLRALQLYEKELNGKIYPNFQQEDVNRDFF